jgi:ribosomal protein S18 acetylase RimI-like enzyme
MVEPVFRPLEDRDIDATLDLWRRCGMVCPRNDSYQEIATTRRMASSDVLVGILETAVIAAIVIEHDGHRGVFYNVTVAPEYRRRGFGKKTIRAGENWLRRRGVRKVNLLLRTDNAELRRFYERLGYTIDPVFPMGGRILTGQTAANPPGRRTA